MKMRLGQRFIDRLADPAFEEPSCGVLACSPEIYAEMMRNGYMETMQIPDYQLRVLNEKLALDELIRKLSTFMTTETYVRLDGADRALLMEQRTHMMQYSNVLLARIVRFKSSVLLQRLGELAPWATSR